MQSIHLAARQPYTGELTNKDPISSRLPLIGQFNPVVEERWSLSQGRAVAGLGMTAEANQEERKDDYVEQIEQEDDVWGSGIFDRSGRAGTIHPTMGVFADHPSVPGYIARETQFAVSREIIDIANGAEVVAVPGGGMAYVERGGRNVGPIRTDDHMNPYVILRPDKGNAYPGRLGPVRTSDERPMSVPPAFTDGGTTPVPYDPNEVPMQPTSQAFSPDNPQYGTAYQKSIPAVGWFGADAPASTPVPPAQPGWGSYLAAGAIVGTAVAIFVGTLNPPKKRRRAA